MGFLVGACGCSPALVRGNASEEKADFIIIPLAVGPDSSVQIDLGQIGASRRVEQVLYLENSNSDPITVARLETSCPCLSFQDVIATVAPKRKLTARLIVDLRNEPDFTGSLALRATGFNERDQVVFKSQIYVRFPR